MEDYCENCGAPIKENSKFCHECGSEIERPKEEHNFCPNCGNELAEDEEFCGECGENIKNPQTADSSKKSFIEENKIPVAIVAVVAIVVLSLLLTTAIPNGGESHNYDVGTQNVEVDTVNFKIPGDYRLIPASIDYDYKNNVMTYQHTYANGKENITIMIFDSNIVDANEVNDMTGGVKKTMYGYDGYYQEFEDGYAFNFVTGNKLCVILVSSPYIFDQIEVIG